MKKLLIGMVLLVATSSFAQSPEDQLVAALKNLNAISTHFDQTIFSSKFGDEKANGEMVLQKPDKMYWSYEVPKGRLFLADGENFYRYDAQDGVEHKSAQKELMDQTNSFSFLLKHQDLQKHFTVASEKKDKGRFEFTLVPKNEGADMQKIVLEASFSPFVIYQMETLDSIGQKNLLVFSSQEINPTLSAKVLDYEKAKKKAQGQL